MFSQPFSTYYLPIPRHILHKPLIPSWEFGQLFRVGRAKLLQRWRRTIFGIFILFHLNLFFNLFQHRAEHDGNWGRGITWSTNFFGNIDSVCQKPNFFQCCFCRRLHWKLLTFAYRCNYFLGPHFFLKTNPQTISVFNAVVAREYIETFLGIQNQNQCSRCWRVEPATEILCSRFSTFGHGSVM